MCRNTVHLTLPLRLVNGSVVVSNSFYVHPYGEMMQFDEHIFQMGWNMLKPPHLLSYSLHMDFPKEAAELHPNNYNHRFFWYIAGYHFAWRRGKSTLNLKCRLRVIQKSQHEIWFQLHPVYIHMKHEPTGANSNFNLAFSMTQMLRTMFFSKVQFMLIWFPPITALCAFLMLAWYSRLWFSKPIESSGSSDSGSDSDDSWERRKRCFSAIKNQR